MDLKEKARKLPSSPGVYIMKDSLNSIIYVGKSKNLKSRVSSYFHNSKSRSPKVEKLVKNIRDFDYVLTDTEFEAFMLECRLIQEIKPGYNKKMKSPLSYCFIRIGISESYPSIEVTNESDKEDDALYFGPYTSYNTVERAVQGMKESCKILCSSKSKKASACLNYSLGTCIGICKDSEGIRELYEAAIVKIIQLLNEKDKSLINEIEHAMNIAAENLDFETASKYRDYIGAVNYLLGSKPVLEFTEQNNNIVLIERLSEDCFKFFLVKRSKILFSDKYSTQDTDLSKLKNLLVENILIHFEKNITEDPSEINKDEIDQAQIIFSYIKNSSNNCSHAIIADELHKHEAYEIVNNLLHASMSDTNGTFTVTT